MFAVRMSKERERLIRPKGSDGVLTSTLSLLPNLGNGFNMGCELQCAHIPWCESGGQRTTVQLVLFFYHAGGEYVQNTL